jgi:hypothetical protein
MKNQIRILIIFVLPILGVRNPFEVVTQKTESPNRPTLAAISQIQGSRIASIKMDDKMHYLFINDVLGPYVILDIGDRNATIKNMEQKDHPLITLEL